MIKKVKYSKLPRKYLLIALLAFQAACAIQVVAHEYQCDTHTGLPCPAIGNFFKSKQLRDSKNDIIKANGAKYIRSINKLVVTSKE